MVVMVLENRNSAKQSGNLVLSNFRVTRYITREGYMLGRLYFLREGVLYYHRDEFSEVPSEIPADQEWIGIYYNSDALWSSSFEKSIIGKPLTMGHPESVTIENYSEYAIGHLGSAVFFDIIGTVMHIGTDYLITDKDVITSLGDALPEVSAQVNVQYLYYPGVAVTGEYEEPYDYVVTELHLNHVAIVEEGRAGGSVRLLNGSNQEVLGMEKDPKAEVQMPNSADVEQKARFNELENSVTVLQDSVKSMSDLLRSSLSAANSGAPAPAPAAVPAARAPHPATPSVSPGAPRPVAREEGASGIDLMNKLNSLQSENEALRTRLKEVSSVDKDSEIALAVKDLTNAYRKAEAILPGDYSKLTRPVEVMRHCLKNKYPDLGIDQKSDAYVSAYFDSIAVSNNLDIPADGSDSAETPKVVDRATALRNANKEALARRLGKQEAS